MAGSSSTNPGEGEHPYPSHVCALNFVTVKLSGRSMYNVWKTQMLCLLESHDMLGFITPEENMGREKVGLWRRSDALVKGWILGSLSEQVLVSLVNSNIEFTANDLWHELQTVYGPIPETQAQAQAQADLDEIVEEDLVLEESSRPEYATSKHQEEIEKERDEENQRAKLHPSLYEATQSKTYNKVYSILRKGEITVTDQIKDMEILKKMLNSTRDIEKATLFAGISGDDLLVNIISSKDYNSACDFLKHYSKFHSDAVLMAIAQNFPRKFNIWGETTYEWDEDDPADLIFGAFLAISVIASVVVFAFKRPVSRWIIYPCVAGAIYLAIIVIYWIYMYLKRIIFVMQGVFVEDGARMHSDATRLLKAILEATRQNAYEVVVLIVSYFPDAVWSVNEEGHNIIQYAVINRSEKVYNLLYQMSEHKNIYRTIKDPFGNNLLHLAARLAPPDKLSHISGAALQIQRELQWFKEVERFICPLNIKQKNKHGDTPQMVFTREHKELVIEGEKWMKATAESYTITAALITTIMFASAITVPGGNNQDTGIPVFSNKPAFTTFAVSVAVSLFTSITSLLMFLSILTTRFAEQDFLFNLPTKLIIGLTTLFISTTAMIVAFGATLLLVFGQRHSWILIPIIALTCLPITSFLTLQHPLIADLVTSTYGRSIFGKKRDVPFY